jgi:hypothetical protein
MAAFEKDPGLQAADKESLARPRNPQVDDQHGRIWEIDHMAEKKLLRKIYQKLITLFGALYFMSFLGRLQSCSSISILILANR